jgi:hypothetical protein
VEKIKDIRGASLKGDAKEKLPNLLSLRDAPIPRCTRFENTLLSSGGRRSFAHTNPQLCRFDHSLHN